MPIQHPRLRGAGKMSYIHVTEENIDKEHICCAMSGKQSLAKKEWLKQRFNEGLVFYRSEERGKCFIEYIPAEKLKSYGCCWPALPWVSPCGTLMACGSPNCA